MKAKYLAVLVISLFLIIIIGNEIIAHPPPNKPPVASLWTHPDHVPPGFKVTFDGSSSYDPDGKIVECQWDVDNDGNWEHTESCPAGNCTKIWEYRYDSEGTYTVKFRVKDNDGAYRSATDPVYVYECYWCSLGLGPATVEVNFSGIQSCFDPGCDMSDPPNGQYTLDKISNCEWRYRYPDDPEEWILRIFWRPYSGPAPLGGTELTAEASTTSYWFYYDSDVPCEWDGLESSLTCDPPAPCGGGGTGTVTVVWPTPTPTPTP